MCMVKYPPAMQQASLESYRRKCPVQVWVITGDKQETAINIAIACKLIRQPDSLLICNENSSDAANARLEVLAEKLRSQYEPLSHHNPAPFAGVL